MAYRAYSFFETGFKMCTKHFSEDGLILVDKEDFPDFDKAIASLPTESSANEKPGFGDEEPEDVDP